MIKVSLSDPLKQGQSATVNNRGELIVGRSLPSTASTAIMGTANTAVNFWGPKAGCTFIITDILLYANKSVGAGDATVTIYESTDGPATSTQSVVILSTEMLKKTSRDLTGLNLEVTAGNWVNGITDDDDIFATIMGYYVTT